VTKIAKRAIIAGYFTFGTPPSPKNTRISYACDILKLIIYTVFQNKHSTPKATHISVPKSLNLTQESAFVNNKHWAIL
jgi:hypothetical protein